MKSGVEALARKLKPLSMALCFKSRDPFFLYRAAEQFQIRERTQKEIYI